jgi:hypothetical protein
VGVVERVPVREMVTEPVDERVAVEDAVSLCDPVLVLVTEAVLVLLAVSDFVAVFDGVLLLVCV